MQRLPIDTILPELKQTVAGASSLVLQAPPGAGKTTRVPLALLDLPELGGGRIIMLEPRRLAARLAPASVKATWRVVRWNNTTSWRNSSNLTALLTAVVVTPRRAAAAVKLCSSATARNDLSPSNEVSVMAVKSLL